MAFPEYDLTTVSCAGLRQALSPHEERLHTTPARRPLHGCHEAVSSSCQPLRTRFALSNSSAATIPRRVARAYPHGPLTIAHRRSSSYSRDRPHSGLGGRRVIEKMNNPMREATFPYIRRTLQISCDAQTDAAECMAASP